MMTNKAIYQHFSLDDAPFIDKGLEWIKRVEDTYTPVLTAFVNPHASGTYIEGFGWDLWTGLCE